MTSYVRPFELPPGIKKATAADFHSLNPSNHDSMSKPKAQRSALSRAADTALVPLHAATSKKAQKAYLGTVLFGIVSIALLSLSTIAFILFYNYYVPNIGIERAIHLQFGQQHPFGIASVRSSLSSYQPYDIRVSLHLPRTPTNLATGNFMLDMALLGPEAPASSILDPVDSVVSVINGSSSPVLHRSRRPAILTYASPIVDTAHKLTGLPWYVTGWKKESETLEVSMFEGVEFTKGWKNIPDRVRLVVEADEKMQFYEVKVKVRARFRNLRWFLYNYKLTAFFMFTTSFFSVSMTTASLAYLAFSVYLSNSDQKVETSADVKRESSRAEGEGYNPLSTSDLSDSPRNFPTRGRQMTLQYPGDDGRRLDEETARIKKEEDDEESTRIMPLAGEADDEEEEEEDYKTGSGWRDSGIGTGMDEGESSNMPKRRRSRYNDK